MICETCGHRHNPVGPCSSKPAVTFASKAIPKDSCSECASLGFQLKAAKKEIATLKDEVSRLSFPNVIRTVSDAEKVSEVLQSDTGRLDRAAYRREWMRKRRAAEKAAKEGR